MKIKEICKQAAALTAAAALFVLCSCQPDDEAPSISVPEVTGEFAVSVLKVGQADAMVLRTEQHCVILDCGEKDDGGEVSEYLSENGISMVDYLFITHFDKDHVGGAAEVLDNITVGEIVTPAYKGSNGEYRRYLESARKHDITTTELAENMSFVLDDVLFEVYPPMKNDYVESDNDFSLAISVAHGENRFLFAGDAEKVRLAEIMEQIDGTYNFLKVPHHGRYNGNTEKFFEAVKPEISVITCSKKKSRGGRNRSGSGERWQQCLFHQRGRYIRCERRRKNYG